MPGSDDWDSGSGSGSEFDHSLDVSKARPGALQARSKLISSSQESGGGDAKPTGGGGAKDTEVKNDQFDEAFELSQSMSQVRSARPKTLELAAGRPASASVSRANAALRLLNPAPPSHPALPFSPTPCPPARRPRPPSARRRWAGETPRLRTTATMRLSI